MPRTSLFRRLLSIDDAARLSGGGSAEDGIRRRDRAVEDLHISRRRLLGVGLEGAALAALGAGALRGWLDGATGAPKPAPGSIDVGIVGAGLAGLVCADALAAAGTTATVYEAAPRAGGRCWSLPGFFPGQVGERGGELIDTGHKTMIALAKRFGLALEDVNKEPGEVRYLFNGQIVSEAAVVGEYRVFVDAMRDDLRTLSNTIDATTHTPRDAALDRISLLAYLDGANASGRPAGPLARAAIIAAYEAEYGLAAAEQSCLGFLLFIHADRRSKYRPFGVFSDERYHVVDGNSRITDGLAAALPRPVELGRTLTRIARATDGRIVLTFDGAGGRRKVRHDQVVITLPFTVLRRIEITAGVGIPADQRLAIDTLGYGTNAKLVIGLTGRPWRAVGGNGASYSDLADHQTTWETNPINAAADRAVITDYASGPRGARLDPRRPGAEAVRFLAACDRVIPGTAAALRRTANGTPVADLAHWPSNPLSRGSYTCYRPGQFTTLAGLEGRSVGNLHFAGEHTDSFYSWQGFMEGACLSGLAAARAVTALARGGAGV
jgi:monoamine oxidase